MTAFTVIVETCGHAETLWFSLASVQAQTLSDFELIVTGEGAGRTAEIVEAMAERDPRIRFLPHDAGERGDGATRRRALDGARGRCVAYLREDELWFPDHLATLDGLLTHHDLAHTMQIDLDTLGSALTDRFDADADPVALERMRGGEPGFGRSSAGHTLEAYRRLPHDDGAVEAETDAGFWLRFLDQPWCGYASYAWPDVVRCAHVASAWSAERRAAELQRIAVSLPDPTWRDALVRRALVAMDERSARAGERPRRDAAADDRYCLGDVLRFGVRGNASRYWITGTYPPESWGAWLRGTLRAVLPRGAAYEEAPGSGPSLTLTLTLVHYLPGPSRPRSEARIAFNGETIARIAEDAAAERTYTLPIPELLAADRDHDLVEIEPIAPVSPQALGLGGDVRELGIGIVEMRIDRR